MPINPSFVDPSFNTDGYLESDESFAAIGVEDFKAEWTIPRSDWRDAIEEKKADDSWLSRYMLPLNNQSPESSCVSNATEAIIRGMMGQQFGMAGITKLSPMSLYVRVCSYRHSGSTCQGNLHECMTNGILPEDTDENKAKFDHTYRQNAPFPGTGSGVLPSGWKETAKFFTNFEFYNINSKEQFASAVLQNWGICYGRSGHSIAACELVYDNGRYLIKYLDSYGPGRGDGGFLYDSESYWNTGGAWCCRAVPSLPENVNTGK